MRIFYFMQIRVTVFSSIPLPSYSVLSFPAPNDPLPFFLVTFALDTTNTASSTSKCDVEGGTHARLCVEAHFSSRLHVLPPHPLIMFCRSTSIPNHRIAVFQRLQFITNGEAVK